jgi:tripartite-type tricarboxylate transporter receptor subunit TctC
MRIQNVLVAIVAIAVGLVASINSASAQNYPTRAITLVIPFAPGGSTSIVGRGIADKMSELLGEKVVVDNRPGAGGTVGTRAVAKSEPDGYTLVLGYTGTLAIGPSLYKSVGYDPRKDFAPIGLIGNAPNSLVVNPSFPAKTVAELIAYAKANPGKVNFGSAGAGTASHITGEYFARSAGITPVHIPYKGKHVG